MTPLLGFTPDQPKTTPGIIVTCDNLIPHDVGMRVCPSQVSIADALAAACVGAANLDGLIGGARFIAGTSTKLYELSGTTWVDKSRGGNYSGVLRWSIAQFGGTVVASNISTTIQTSTGVGVPFADQATAPKAAIIETVLSSGGGFVFAFATDDGTYGNSSDRWWCCAANDVTSWTPSISTQAATGRLLGGGGAINAAKLFGSDRIVAYKDKALFFGSYAGGDSVWNWQEIPGYGCVGIEAVANLGTAHFVVGKDTIYIFDGVRPINVADGVVRQWFFDNSSETFRFRTQVRYSKKTDLVWIFFPGTFGSGVCDQALVYHLGTKQWGAVLSNIGNEASFNYDSADTQIGVFNADHNPGILDGDGGSALFGIQYIGDDTVVTRATTATLQYKVGPLAASVTAYSLMSADETVAGGQTVSASDIPSGHLNKFTFRSTGRWHYMVFTVNNNCHITHFDSPLLPVGVR